MYDRLPTHLTRLSYVEEKDIIEMMKVWALVNGSSVSDFVRQATAAKMAIEDAGGNISKLTKRVKSEALSAKPSAAPDVRVPKRR